MVEYGRLSTGGLSTGGRLCKISDTARRRRAAFRLQPHLVMFRLVLSARTPPSTFQISLQTWFTNSLAWEMTSKTDGTKIGTDVGSPKAGMTFYFTKLLEQLHTKSQVPQALPGCDDATFESGQTLDQGVQRLHVDVVRGLVQRDNVGLPET